MFPNMAEAIGAKIIKEKIFVLSQLGTSAL
jgi:hypothetical protein